MLLLIVLFYSIKPIVQVDGTWGCLASTSVCNYPLLMLDVVDYSQPFYKGNHQMAHQSTKYTFNRRAIKLHMLQCFQNGHI